MRRYLAAILIALFAVIFVLAGHSTSTIKNKVLMISIDGLRPDFYLSANYDAPTLRALAANGAVASGVVPVFPTVTYPNHTSLITGVSPRTHGVLSNTIFTWQGGPKPGWLWEVSNNKAPSLLNIALQNNLTTASLRWPVTLFGQATYMVPEIFGMDGYYEGEDWDLTVKYTEPKLLSEIVANIPEKTYSDELTIDHWVASAAKYLSEAHSPDLTLVHLANVDHVEHGFGPNSAETKEAVLDADQNVAKILAGIDLAKTCVLIVGDHGFMSVEKNLSPNVLFLQKGWLTADSNGVITSWKVIAHASGAQAAIYTKDASLVSEIHKLLKDNENIGYRVIEKAQLDAQNSYPEAALAISANDGFAVSGSVKYGLVSDSPKVKGQHGHFPDDPKIYTGFIASGCGIKHEELGVISILNVAPTAAKLLGVEFKGFEKPALEL